MKLLYNVMKNNESLFSDEDFRIVEFPFRPTAENFARYFFDYMKMKGCPVTRVRVYETPNNCASYSE